MKRLIMLVAFGWTAFAPASATGAMQWQGTITDSAGVTIVDNAGRGVWGDGEEWRVVEDLRIGSVEDADDQFGEIASLAVATDGTIYVLDAQAQRIRVYDAAGDYRRTVAGPGSGPGQLAEGADFITIGGDGTLFVPDPFNARINLYDVDGRSTGSAMLAPYGTMAWRGTTSGVIARQTRSTGTGTAESMDVIERLDTGGSVRDTLLGLAGGETFSGTGASLAFTILAVEPIWTIDDEAVYYGMNDDYRISRYANGELTRIIARTFERRAVGDGDRETLSDAVMGAARDAARNAGVSPAEVEPLRELIRFPDDYPAFANLEVGPAGSLWVQHVRDFGDRDAAVQEGIRVDARLLQRGGAGFLDVGSRNWDVFDAEGRFLGVASMPDRFEPLLFRGTHIYGVWRDALDVEYVMRARIEGA